MNPMERFFKSIKKTDTCWLWKNAITNEGYGKFYHKKYYSSHRYSWIIHKGKIPKGLCVLHKCDVRNCVNPDHLWLGTLKDNTRDMILKGRNKNGATK